ncbi:glycosyltransferase [Agriterribacter sp.]|uniref:glycosyltransferase n=1 Tax=Agriterribacter sp. TaxID=2821509 RepID=UPI002BC5366D|nr:glycosyltransferase [Agriterribacter sp.]HTN06232.1 glycosyltransferase [Agriterribacter sp.]
MKVLWLVSWYPNQFNPFDGDFIERHAKAVSQYSAITVIHVVQYGPQIEVPRKKVEIKEAENVKEYIIYFAFKRTGIPLLDKIIYNGKYYLTYSRFIRNYFKEAGLPDLVHVHVPMKSGVIAKWIKKKWNIPYIISEHSSAYYKLIPDNYFNRSAYYRHTVSGIFKHAAKVTTVSAALGKRLQEIFSLPSFLVIHNVADTNVFFPGKNQSPVFRFFHASTMNHPKNVEGILYALAGLSTQRGNWECILAGWETPQLRQIAASLGLDKMIKWTGVLTHEQVAMEMQYAHALVMFSRYENFPCVIIEALCCGLPVIATNVGGIPEAISDSNGWLVPSENEGDLLKAMIRMIDNYDAFNRYEIAKDAENKYNYGVIGKQFYSLYQQVLTQTIPSAF